MYFQLLQDLVSGTGVHGDEQGQAHGDGSTGGGALLQPSADSPGGGDETGPLGDPDSVGEGDASLQLATCDPQVNTASTDRLSRLAIQQRPSHENVYLVPA